MVKTQISHPTFNPLISGFDWQPFFLFFFLSPVCFSCCWLCLSVCVITRSQQPWACLLQPHWISSLLSLPSFSPLLSLSLSPSQDEGPQHLISTSAVKVQRLLALLHIMKEGWSLDPAGNPLKDWVTQRGIPELFLFYFFPFFANASFSLFCFGVCGRRFFAETNFLLLFFRHDGEKKNLYRLIVLKACILTEDIQ